MAARSVRAAFCLFGVASLLPWNVFLCTMSYINDESFPGKDWQVELSPLFNATNCFFQVLMLVYGSLCPPQPVAVLLIVCAAGALASLGLMSLSVPEPSTVEGRFYSAQALCAVVAAVTGLLQSCVGTLSGKLMSKHGPLMPLWSIGVAIAGVLGTLVAVPLSFLWSPAGSTCTLFILVSAIYAASVVAALRLQKTGQFTANENTAEDAVELSQRGGSSNAAPEANLAAKDSASIYDVLLRVWPQELGIFAIYAQTFLAFPAVSGQWSLQANSVPPPWEDVIRKNYHLIGVSIFQIFDLLGRFTTELPSLHRCWPKSRRLWVLIAPRSLLLLAVFNGWSASESPWGNPFCHAFAMAALAFTNGMLTNVAFMRGIPDALPEDRDFVGRAMPLALVLGIVTGSYISSSMVLQMKSSG